MMEEDLVASGNPDCDAVANGSVCNDSATVMGKGPPLLVDAWLVPTFFGVIMLVGLVGNSLVIHVVTKQQQMKTVTNFYIGSLLLSIPVARYQRLEAGYWFGPQTYCSEAFPSLYLQRAFILYSFLVVYLLPLLAITACYAFMLKRMGQPGIQPMDSNYQVTAQVERTAAVRARISRMVVVIVVLFPIQVCILLQAFGLRSYALYKLKILGHCMSYSNSSVNPLVYAFMGNNFRKAFKHTFPAVFSWRAPARARVGNRESEWQAPKRHTEMHFLSSGT